MAKKPLPLPGHFEHLWMDIRKIIYSLHIANHKDRQCRETYNPEQLMKDHPQMNTMYNVLRTNICMAIKVLMNLEFYAQVSPPFLFILDGEAQKCISRKMLYTRPKTSGASRQIHLAVTELSLK